MLNSLNFRCEYKVYFGPWWKVICDFIALDYPVWKGNRRLFYLFGAEINQRIQFQGISLKVKICQNISCLERLFTDKNLLVHGWFYLMIVVNKNCLVLVR